MCSAVVQLSGATGLAPPRAARRRLRLFVASSFAFVLALVLAGAVLPAFAQAGAPGAAPAAGPVRVEAVEVELVSRQSAVAPGQPLELGLRIAHDPDWHTYWRNPGDSGLPTELDLALPPGFAAGGILWPAPQRLFIPPLANYGYEGEIVLPVPVEVPATIDARSVRVDGKAAWLMCREVCIPGEAEVSLTLPVAGPGSAAPAPTSHAALFEAAHARMPVEPLEAQASIVDGKLSLGLPLSLSRAEFFPYREGLIDNAGAQVLYAVDAEGAPPRRLEIEAGEGAVASAAQQDLALEAARGVLVTDSRIFELRPLPAASPLPAGSEIARVAAAPDSVPPAASAGFRLPGFGPGNTRERASSALPPSTTGGAGGGVPGAGPVASRVDLLVAALFAAVGGLLLNLMPCVFPVIGLKVLGFARHGGGAAAPSQDSRRASRAGALAFSAGVLVSFWLLAAVLVGLRAAGQAAGWGFQLQSPTFVAAMALLFVAIALNFSGVYEFGMAMTRLGQHDPSAGHSGARLSLAGSFGSGVLAVLVATPCTAPFMGSALGFTLSAGPAQTLLVFTALGAGMALPYLLLGLFPGWLRWLPRPGRWMESFRQALAFPMYATAAWLAWVLGRQAGMDAVLALTIGAVLVALAAWLYGRFVQRVPLARASRSAAQWRRAGAASLALASLLLGLFIARPPGEASRPLAPEAARGAAARADAAGWRPWSADAVAAAMAAGRPVFVDFTAAWCVSCQVNKRLVLDRASIVQAMAGADVLRLRADWTNEDAAITAELARHGRNGVPLYLLFRPGTDQPLVLPELLTPGIVLEALAGLGPAPDTRVADLSASSPRL